MTDATTSATSPSPYAAAPSGVSSEPETSPWFAWGVAGGASLIVVLILVGAVYVNPIVSLLSGMLLATGVAATYLGVWLDDQNGPVTIFSPVVLFVAVIALVLSVMTITGVFDLTRFGVPADVQAGPAIESSQAASDASSSAAPTSVPAK